MTTLTEFLLARIAEDERRAKAALVEADYIQFGDTAAEALIGLAESEGAQDEALAHFASLTPARVLAECEAKRRIVELHRSWPVLVETTPTVERVDSADPGSFAFRASQQIAWTTEQQYREHFGTEPPTAPMMLALAAVYADHPDYRDEWRP